MGGLTHGHRPIGQEPLRNGRRASIPAALCEAAFISCRYFSGGVGYHPWRLTKARIPA